MDWKQILSLSKENLSDEKKEEIYNELIKDQFDLKISKKLFPLCLTLLKFKGKQVEKQRDEIEMLTSSDIDLRSTLDQIEKQKKMLNKYEAERLQFKARIKELTDEIAMMHGRELQGINSTSEDSPDQLSEIDKQEELMGKISAKNKHIKKLLRDIEKYEQQSTKYINVIKELKANVEDASGKISQLDGQLKESNENGKFLEEKVAHLLAQLQEQEIENQKLQNERQEREKEIENFSTQLEERIALYKGILNEKQRELDALGEKYETLIQQVPGIDVDSEQSEIKRLVESIRERDELIKAFKAKLELLSAELMDSTQVIERLNDEREEWNQRLSRTKSDKCCEDIQQMLAKSNERNKELQEMLEMAEDDNFLKSKQAFEAIETLKSYENSQDGLADALKKIHKLQETIHQRDKQIQEFVLEINAQNEVVAENSILRKRLGLTDDEIIETKTFLAKQKRYTKINDRLMLKLRASEEMRLQLKLDKNDLKRKIFELEKQLNGESEEKSTLSSENDKDITITKKQKTHEIEMKECEKCSITYNVYESLKFCRNCIMKQYSNFCENCTASLKVTSTENIELTKKIAKLEVDNQAIIDENENLRIGLNEILEKLRDYEVSSEKTIINSATLEKLLYILNLRNNNVKIVTASDANESETNKQLITSVNNTDDKLDTHVDDDETLRLKLLIKELSDENEAVKVELENMKHLQEQYEELVRSSELCDDDKFKLLVESLERCHKFETNIKSYERKIDFLKNENDNLYREMKTLKAASLELSKDMKMEILSKAEEMIAIDICDNETDDKEDIFTVQQELQQLRLELNGLCFNVLKNIKSLDDENILKLHEENFSNVAILEHNNIATFFITRQEYETMKSKLVKLQETINIHETREKHLEELTKIAQYQLKSQQLMLSQFSDDEICARHLIVDLQSQSNENYLLTKTTRDLKIAKDNEDQMRLESEKLKSEIIMLQESIQKKQHKFDEKYKELSERESNNILKIQYLKKSLVDLCNQYSSFTPIYLITDFIKNYATLLEAKKQFEMEMTMKIRSQLMPETLHSSIVAQLNEMSMTDIEGKIEIIKYKSSCDYLKQQLEMNEATIKELHNEIARIKVNEIKTAQHWNAIRMLFGSDGDDVNANEDNNNINDNQVKEESDDEKKIVISEKVKFDKEIQVDVIKTDCGTNTDVQTDESHEIAQPQIHPQISSDEQNSLEQQLKKALSLASSRSSLLIETENRLSEAQGRIKVLERNLENQHKLRVNEQQASSLSSSTSTTQVNENFKKDDHILGITIATLQSLIVDKDTNLSRYQELLKSERQHNMRTFDELSEQIKQLKKTINNHEVTIDEREKLIEKLKSNIADEKLKNEKEKEPDDNIYAKYDMQSMELKLKEAHTEMKKTEQRLKDLTNTERLLQNIINERDLTIKELNIKLKASNDNLDTLSENFTSTGEIDQLREMLEEKDKHIQDLTETLNQFHDDQQKYITDTAINSAEQVQIISSNLTRTESSNRILTTQMEVLKRQLTNIQQREKQSRDMIKTLKNQLIKRPVISIKSDKRNATTTREEQQQKKINELENELFETKDELRRQININDNKRAKNAAELGLWDKQKRYQEMSEKLKGKLTEKEIDCERMKANLQMAKNNIKRLENEKIMLENKLKSGRYLQNVQTCLQCQHNSKSHSLQIPDSLSMISESSEANHELIAALKSRIETQQRRIVSMELEGKGSSAYASEVGKLQEQLSELQARNIRLESKNIQLQLDYDMVKENDSGKKQEERIKHLEDYIIVLKDELAQSHVSNSDKSRHHEAHPSKLHAMEQTILNLKLIVEKLQAENKYLRSARNGSSSSSVLHTNTYMSVSDRKKEELFEKLKIDYEKLQKNYQEVLREVSALQIELELSQAQIISASCPHCSQKGLDELATQDVDSLREQLQQKTMLLDKAKSLLSRAAAKEKHFKETISNLKKKVCNLEGIPVISEENSESN